MQAVTAGSNPIVLKKGIDKTCDYLVKKLKEVARPVKGTEDIRVRPSAASLYGCKGAALQILCLSFAACSVVSGTPMSTPYRKHHLARKATNLSSSCEKYDAGSDSKMSALQYMYGNERNTDLVEKIPRQGRLEGGHRMFAATHLICGLQSV